jgi:glycosyltransferase involved in cell wall biosynthesis
MLNEKSTPEVNAPNGIQPSSEPLISVGIPTFNRPHSLARTLDCVRFQTYKNLEILISDNCSPNPEVRQVIERYSRIDNRIKGSFNKSNRGPGFNFRKVLEESRGDYFMWASDDDYWRHDFIETLFNLYKKNPNAVIAFCDMEVRNADDSRASQYKPFYTTFRPYEHASTYKRLYSYALQEPSLGKANLVFGLHKRKSLLMTSKKYFESTAWGSDMLLACNILSNGELILSPEKLFAKYLPTQDSEYTSPENPASASASKKAYIASRLKHNAHLFLIAIQCKQLKASERILLMRGILKQTIAWWKNDRK